MSSTSRILATLGIGLATLLAASPTAWAGGMEFPEGGTRAMGRAGAFTAKADDPTAIVLNPAGLAWVKGLQITLDTNLIRQNLCFKRAGNYPGTPGPYTYAGQPYPKVCRDLGGMFFSPIFSVSYDFGLPNWTFAVGGYGPQAVGTRNFPMQVSVTDTNGNRVRAPGPTRYDTDYLNAVLMFFTVAAAYRPVEWLSLGVAVQLVQADIDYSTHLTLSSNTDPDGDIRFRIKNKGFTATGLFSTLIKPWRGLSLGFSVRLPVRAEIRGDAFLHLPSYLESMQPILRWMPDTHKASMATDLPLAIRTGIRYAWKNKMGSWAPDLGDIELDIIWERWSATKSMDTVVNAEMLAFGGEPLAPFKLAHFYQDTSELRLGGSFTVPKRLGGGWLTFRLGAHYGGDASPKEYTRLDYAAWARVGLFAGLSYRIAGVDMHVGFAYMWNGTGESWKPWTFKAKRVVEASCVTHINALAVQGEPVFCNPADMNPNLDISRGESEATFWTISLGFTINVWELADAIKGKKGKAGAIKGAK